MPTVHLSALLHLPDDDFVPSDPTSWHPKAGEEWGSFDEDDWGGKPKAGADCDGEAQRDGESKEDEEFLIRPQGAGTREAVPGLLGGARFDRMASKAKAEEVEVIEGEEMGGEVRDEATRSAGR